MTAPALEAVLRIALPPLRLALRERYLAVRRQDPRASGTVGAPGPTRTFSSRRLGL